MDGHKTHTQNIAVNNKARNHRVTILCLPPHCSHRMQPLDVAFMAPLSTYYSQEVEIFLRNNPGRVVTIYQISKLFGKAHLRAATPTNAINGFEKTGLFPSTSGLKPNQNTSKPVYSSSTDDEFTSDDEEPLIRLQQKALVAPEMIRPYPKAPKRHEVNKKNRGKAAVLKNTL